MPDAPQVLLKFTFTSIVSSLAVLVLTWIIIRWVSRLLDLFSRRSSRARFYIKYLEPVVRITLWMAAFLIVFELVGPSSETFYATIASVGLALGLGAQDLVKNLVGGFVVLGDRPYQLGDRVRIGDAYGEIDHIGLRSTKLTTPDDTRVTIPNADVLSHQVFNSNSGVPDCQVVTDVCLPADTDPDLAHRIGREAALCCPFLLVRKPVVVLLTSMFDQRPYLRLRIKCYVHDHRFEPRMMSDITSRTLAECARLGIVDKWEQMGTAS